MVGQEGHDSLVTGLVHHTEHSTAIPLHLDLADPRNLQQGGKRHGFVTGDIPKGLVMKNNKRRDPFFLGQLPPQLAKAFKELRID